MPLTQHKVRSHGSVTTYEGFRYLASQPEEFIAVVHFDGDPELWGLDWYVGTEEVDGQAMPHQKGIDDLKRYYKEQHGRDIEPRVYQLRNDAKSSNWLEMAADDNIQRDEYAQQ